jgi:hypothetical protein
LQFASRLLGGRGHGNQPVPYQEGQPKTIRTAREEKDYCFSKPSKQHVYTYVELKSAQLLGVVEGSEVTGRGAGVSRTASLGAGAESVAGLAGVGTSFSGIFSA